MDYQSDQDSRIAPGRGANPVTMLSALLMFRRLARTLRYAVREEEFLVRGGAPVDPCLACCWTTLRE